MVSASDNTEPLPIHTQAVTDCPVLAVHPGETLASAYCTTLKDDTTPTILHQTWQAHATPTTPEPSGKSTNANVHSQVVLDMGLEVSIPQHNKSIKSNVHVNPTPTNQTLGFRNLFHLTLVKVGLIPMTDPPAHRPPSLDITIKPTYTIIPIANTQSLKFSPSPISTPLKATTPSSPHTNPSTVQLQLKASTQPPISPPSSKPLKSKVTEKEIANFAK